MPTDTDPARPWRIADGGLLLTVRLTPRGGRDALEGVAEWDGRPVLRARVAAAPVDGAANAALIRLLAKALGIAPRDVTLATGETARVKEFRISGDASTLARRLAAL